MNAVLQNKRVDTCSISSDSAVANRQMRECILTKQGMLPARQRLLELMQDLNFGTIHCLTIRNCQPLLMKPPRVTRVIRIGKENGPRAERHQFDFSLKAPVVEMFAHFDAMRDATVTIAVNRGLPTLLTVEPDVKTD